MDINIDMKDKTLIYRVYTRVWIIASLVVLCSVFSINYLVDPLWYNNGSKLSKTNYAYNERISKLNHFLNNKEDFDCLVFGSSVSIVFDTNLIEDSSCYNFSVSAGGLIEYIEYLKYLKWLNYEPKKIYTEINFGFVKPDGNLSRLPEFVVKKELPKTIFESYIGASSLIFSVKSLFGLSPYLHFYDENIVAHTRKELTYEFNPSIEDLYKLPAEPPSISIIEYYKELVSIFPNSDQIGYVYPASPWGTSRYLMHGYLDTNLEIISDLSLVFDDFYDFSYPTPIITDKDSTYDGSHFYEHVFEEIANTLNNKKGVIGYRIIDGEIYKTDYKNKMNEFIDSIQNDPVIN